MKRGLLGHTVRLGSRSVPEADAGRGFAARRVADADEDIVTLTVAALRSHLQSNGQAPDDIGELFLVGAFDDASAATVSAAVGCDAVPVSLFSATPLAAADAVLVAHGRDGDRPTFVAAATDGRERLDVDDWAAGACVLEVGRTAQVPLSSEAHVRRPLANNTAAASAVLEQLDGSSTRTTAVCAALQRPRDARLHSPDTSGAVRLAAPIENVGSLGCAAPLFALASGLEQRAADTDLVWIVAEESGAVGARFGPGALPHGANVHEVVSPPGTGISAEQAARARTAWMDGGRPAQGAFVSMTSYLERADARYRWIGQSCTECAHIQFPPRETCGKCNAHALQAHQLSGAGTVYARTRIGPGGAPTEFAPLQSATGAYHVAVVELAEGPRVAAMCTASDAPVELGDPVHLELRLLYVQDGEARYGFKAVPGRRIGHQDHHDARKS